MKLNVDYYKDEDLYSDGSIEDYLLESFQQGKSVAEILDSNFEFTTFYHLTPLRENLLSWYPFNTNGDILEIGAGCGALTRFLASNCRNLTCIELSEKRSLINYHRNKDLKNVEIIVGNFIDIDLDKQYDYITLIGVLEYCGKYCGKNPYEIFLKDIRKLVKPGGKLIIAIENKFGLKYFAGAYEDHSDKAFVGLEGYKDTAVKTFGKKELTDLLIKTGYTSVHFYYPFPDYKFPRQIFNEHHKEYFKHLENYFPHYNYAQNLFDEKRVFNEILKEEQFEFFANSFLIFASC